jgi:hypothetical protein
MTKPKLCPVCNEYLQEMIKNEGLFLECQRKNCSYSRRIGGTAAATINSPPGKEADPVKAKTEVLGTAIRQIPVASLQAIGSIFEEGAAKYGRNNWLKGVGDREYQEERLEHAIIHLMLYANGDRSENHLAKVAWFCITQLEHTRLEKNENPPK